MKLPKRLNFAIPIDLANDVLQKIIRDGRVIRGYFGVQSDILFGNGQAGRDKGVLITNVMPSSPAAKAGIQAGDIIIKFGEVDAISPAQMMQLISNTKPNVKVNVLIKRLGKMITLPVTIEEYVSN